MAKVNIGEQTYVLPMATTILGSRLKDRPNFMALGWLTRVNSKPPMLGVAVSQGHASHRAIAETGEFSVNFPTVAMVEITDYVGLVSGKRVDKSELFNLFYGELSNAPMISECPLAMECKLVKTVELPTNSFFIGEIVGAYSEEQFLTEGVPDIKKINPFLLTMPDNGYWSVGELIGRAWSDGESMRKRIKRTDTGP
ncbi:MAG: flavin reductase family protein [Deltaproteobacteria bacterium]|nr:flavin reductase family protein [Deltaproteobacteria bacterium]